jgi:signal transduction histidine kinase/type II secretory pathway pseudopilin PulG
MFSRFGLRFHMAASYVVVSAAAVLIVEAVLLAVFVPRMQSASDSLRKAQQSVAQANSINARTRAAALAAEGAAAAGTAVSIANSAQPGMPARKLLAYASKYGFGDQPAPTSQDPGRAPSASESDPSTVRVLATLDGRVVVSSAPKAFPVGSRLPARAVGPVARAGLADVGDQRADWATHPVQIAGSARSDRRVIGIVYVQVPPVSRPQMVFATRDSGGSKASGGAQAFDGAGVLWMPAVIVLVLLVPVGGLFGLLSTRWLIRRIRRLAAGTSAMARGDLQSRIPVSGSDEVGRLEQSFNSMAERLEAAVQRERDTAGSAARRAERTRITRELHDSISQDVFSASLLAGGLRRALPSGSEVRHQAESMEHTLERTMQEMRAMMLELRPVALEDAGLAAAVDELCRAYEARLGIRISADIGSLQLKLPVEHAVLRVVQEALGNAVRHGRPETIELSVRDGDGDGQVTVMVRDDGQGFDQLRASERGGMGLELMRERVAELGGDVEVASTPEQGTTVRVLIPDGVA